MKEFAVQLIRGGHVESRHRIHAAVVDPKGDLQGGYGESDLITSWRSSAKPFQLLPLLERNGDEKFQLSLGELAVMAASHSGESVHVELVEGILKKLDMKETDLECGEDAPINKKAAKEALAKGRERALVYNNCSGKHTGMLALSKVLGVASPGYIKSSHPVQQAMHSMVAECTGMKKEDIGTGIDGCGVPVFFMPLERMAWAYARMGKPDAGNWGRLSSCVEKVRAAMTTYPYHVAGENRLDTILMEVTSGRIVSKGGAEGLHCCAGNDGIALALKVEDGSHRAVAPAAIFLLKHFNMITEKEHGELLNKMNHQMTNARGDVIGYLEGAILS